jgi:iron-sulfur cluster assembly protein
MMFRLTPGAAAQIRRSAADSGAADWALRVAARRDDDGAVRYGMGFDELREGDLPLELEGVRLLVGAPSQALLQGTQLDYVELEPGRFDFVFVPDGAVDEPPPAAGCGSGGCSRCGG